MDQKVAWEPIMSGGAKSIVDSSARNDAPLSAFADHASMQQAELDPVQISLKAICDKYNRLVLQKYPQPQRRSVWSRLFG
jgi:hypothetical protein